MPTPALMVIGHISFLLRPTSVDQCSNHILVWNSSASCHQARARFVHLMCGDLSFGSLLVGLFQKRSQTRQLEFLSSALGRLKCASGCSHQHRSRTMTDMSGLSTNVQLTLFCFWFVWPCKMCWCHRVRFILHLVSTCACVHHSQPCLTTGQTNSGWSMPAPLLFSPKTQAPFLESNSIENVP